MINRMILLNRIDKKRKVFCLTSFPIRSQLNKIISHTAADISRLFNCHIKIKYFLT